MVRLTIFADLRGDRTGQCLTAGQVKDWAQSIRRMVDPTRVKTSVAVLTKQRITLHEKFLQTALGGRDRCCGVN